MAKYRRQVSRSGEWVTTKFDFSGIESRIYEWSRQAGMSMSTASMWKEVYVPKNLADKFPNEQVEERTLYDAWEKIRWPKLRLRKTWHERINLMLMREE